MRDSSNFYQACLPLPSCLHRKTHSGTITSWALANSFFRHFKTDIFTFICCSILGLEFRFHFKTLTIPCCPSKGIKCIKHLVWSGTMQLSKFYCLPNADNHRGHKIPALRFLADSLINSITKESTQKSFSSCIWTWRFYLPPPPMTADVLFQNFFSQMAVLKIFLCLKVCTTVKSCTVWIFPSFNAHF